MGDWLSHYEWIECPERSERIAKALRRSCSDLGLGDERWAVRARRLAPQLVQIETVQKWGHFELFDALSRRMPECKRLAPRFNFLFCQRGETQLDGAVRFLGPGARVVRLGPRSTLCLADPVPFAAEPSRVELAQERERNSPLFRVLDSLARGVPALTGRQTEFLIGLYSPQHGYVHLGMLELGLLESAWPWAAQVHLRVSGEHNTAPVELEVGPSIWALREPAALLPALRAADWPFR